MWVLICKEHLNLCYYGFTYEFYSESTPHLLPERQGSPCLKQASYLKFKWERYDLNPQPLSSLTNTQPFSQTDWMIKLCCEYLSARCIWLEVIIMSQMSFRVNPQSVVCLSVKELLDESRKEIWSLSDSNGFHTHNRFVRKRKLNQLVKLTKWLSCVVSTYLYSAFNFMLLSSCHIGVSKWIHTL